MSINLDPTRPIYLQIMEEIKKRAARETYKPGDQLPSVRDMAKEMEVNPNTIARVYRELESEGFIVTRRGRGSFITGDSERIVEERSRLGSIATQRFINDINELELNKKQIKDLLNFLKSSLSGEKRGSVVNKEDSRNARTGK